MTFNPVSDPPLQTKNPVATLEVTRTRRIVQVALACLYCLFGSGLVFGYAAFKPVLVKEGVYRHLCPTPGDGYKTCYNQELRLNLMFTIAAVCTNVAALPVGTMLDRFGPKVTSIVGSLFIAVGAAFMIVAPRVHFDAYIPGYLFLALGGPFIFISSFQLSNCFPRHSGLILALLTGSFDTSSAVFLVYRLIYNQSEGWFTPQRFFLVYLAVPLFILGAQLFAMPSKSYQTVGEIIKAVESPGNHHVTAHDHGEPTETDRLLGVSASERDDTLSELSPLLGKKDSGEAKMEEDRKKRISRVWGALHGLSAFQQVTTPWWILIAMFVMIQMTRINYFVATIRSQYDNLLGDYEKAVRINNFFDIALPAGGVVSIPFIGLVLDNFSTPFTVALLVCTATAIGILGVLPYEAAAYANIVLFVLYRPLYYTAVSDYAAKVFGFHTFGKVYGLIICISGLFNFSQSALDALTHKTFGGDPRPVNLILLSVAFAVGLALFGFVYRKSMSLAGKAVEEERDSNEDQLRGHGSTHDPLGGQHSNGGL